MQKKITLLSKADAVSKGKRPDNKHLQPSSDTLQKILQFASTYRVEKTSDNQFIEFFLN